MSDELCMPESSTAPETIPSPNLVPNGTSTLPTRIDQFVQKFRSFAKQTAQSIIGLATTLVEAKQALSGDDFDQFCHQVGLDPKGPTYRKMFGIGEKASRFEPILDQVPNNWTTIYALAKLEPDKFESVVDSNVLTPSMTAKALSDFFNETKVPCNRRTMVLNVSDLSSNDAQRLYDELKKLKVEFKIELKLSPALSVDLQPEVHDVAA